MTSKIVTANRLRDGRVVYLAVDGGWSERIEESRRAADEAEAKVLLQAAEAAVEARLVVDPYIIEVAEEGERIRPLRYRETIRATGPSVETLCETRSE